nr:hypothetical protein [uncultured Anaerosporobacter sp.]
MYDIYTDMLKSKYEFEQCGYSMSLDDGFSVTVILTQRQIVLYNSRCNQIEQFRIKAEMFSAQKSHITLGMVPKTTIVPNGNRLTIYGSPDTIEALFFQLFDEGK